MKYKVFISVETSSERFGTMRCEHLMLGGSQHIQYYQFNEFTRIKLFDRTRICAFIHIFFEHKTIYESEKKLYFLLKVYLYFYFFFLYKIKVLDS